MMVSTKTIICKKQRCLECNNIFYEVDDDQLQVCPNCDVELFQDEVELIESFEREYVMDAKHGTAQLV